MFSMMRSICGQNFILICSATLELLPFLTFFAIFNVISFKIFSSDTTGPFGTKLGMNVWGILRRTDMGIFYLSKHMATVTKNRKYGSDNSFLHISTTRLGLAHSGSICGQIFISIYGLTNHLQVKWPPPYVVPKTH